LKLSERSPVFGMGGMVATSQPLATAAGLQILKRGGSAADAAIAAAAALNVTEPGSTGLGGDAFALYYDCASRTVFALNGSGRAPGELTLERLRNESLGENLPPRHAYNVTVPGAAAAWCDLLGRFGRLELADVLNPAIRLAVEGFPVAPITAFHWQRSAEDVLNQALNGKELTFNGRGPRAGEIFHNPGLGKTLHMLAEKGKRAFYEGQIAKSIVDITQEAGGCLSMQDLAQHESTWEQPLSIDYRGIRVWECPPNGQGLAALLALNVLEGYDLGSLPALSPERLHLEIEAMRLAFADARQYVADPRFSPAPLDELLGKTYAAERRNLIQPGQAQADVQHGSPFTSSDTVYLSVVDGDGNACSFINSTYMSFGTGIVPRGWGFSLQNRGDNFSLQSDHPNALAPGKRPYHTIIPAMATHAAEGTLYACFGVMGGYMQPQGHMQVLSALVDDNLDPQAALNRPRFCLQDDGTDGTVALEEGIHEDTVAALVKMGHKVETVSGMQRALFGRGQIILRNPDNGVLCGGSDPRADGCAMTLA
jgi:gamma-glutamyltranspeptidase / glutathione hydrolase